MSDENKQLTEESENPIIEVGNEGAGDNAGDATPEDTFRKVIEGQKSTIDMLMEQVESLNGQITRLAGRFQRFPAAYPEPGDLRL